ncbi:MAG: 1-acyl-sn-glycerol-3-phosphate acyltransferase, partial [Deltaproteobacteria bacterium]|nr:1-acyl-sn-glycerol-3-phosphate acyltransferase [Deltaproteobacteria bacterium]
MSTDQTSKLEKLESDAVLVFANKFKSHFDYLFYHTRYTQDRLHVPEIGLGYKIRIFQPFFRLIQVLVAHLDHLFRHGQFPHPFKRGYVQRQLAEGRCGFFSLVESRGFYKRFVRSEIDPIAHLLEMQQSIDAPVYIVPHLMFFGKKPRRKRTTFWDIVFGNELKPGKLRRLVTLFKYPGKIFIEISEPLNLKKFLAESENKRRSANHLALLLRRRLLVQFNRHRQSITGPLLKSREEMKQSILTNDRLQDIMAQLSSKREIPINKVHKEANDYLDEISANYNSAFVEFAAATVHWITKIAFDGVTVNTDMLNRVKDKSHYGPVIWVPCHKSHIDYLVLPYILYSNNMPVPHVVAGKNLFIWPISPLLRAGGAFSIRRSFKGAVLYAKVFAEYVHKLLEEGFNIELFIEGTRSRTGKVMLPQLGFVSILLNAFKNKACEDIIFAPVYIGYDRVPEEKAYLHEIGGGRKEPENLKQIVKAPKFLKKKYGRIYVKFSEPISLRELSDPICAIQDMSVKEINALSRQLGFRMINAINDAVVVTPHALVACAMLSMTQNRFELNTLMPQIEHYLNHLTTLDVNLSDTLLLDPGMAVEQVVAAYSQRKFIERISSASDPAQPNPVYQINVSKRPNLEYYKNNCINFFIPAAMTALIILKKEAFQFSASDFNLDYTFLQNLFRLEFPIDSEKTPEYCVGKTIKAFVADAILIPHPTLSDTYNLTSPGFKKLGMFARLLKPYLESYWVSLNYFMRSPRNDVKPKDRIRKIQSLGLKLYKRGEIEQTESLSKINYKNA